MGTGVTAVCLQLAQSNCQLHKLGCSLASALSDSIQEGSKGRDRGLDPRTLIQGYQRPGVTLTVLGESWAGVTVAVHHLVIPEHEYTCDIC